MRCTVIQLLKCDMFRFTHHHTIEYSGEGKQVSCKAGKKDEEKNLPLKKNALYLKTKERKISKAKFRDLISCLFVFISTNTLKK